jgi:hypothetical protein
MASYKLKPRQEDKLCSLYKQGVSGPTLARAYGFSQQGVYALLRRNGVKVRPQPWKKPVRRALRRAA